MQQATASTPSPNSPASSELSSFAGLLAALAAPEQNSGAPVDGSSSTGWNSGAFGEESVPAERKAAPAWNDDGLADDVATLSYERALRTHARYCASAPIDESLTQAADAEPIRLEKLLSEAGATAPQAEARPAAKLKPSENLDWAAKSSPESDRPQTTPGERNLKEASVTIRMSKAECAQLHRRAAEAGLTVSAYLRSCTFEAESLREMVRETLAQLRSATTEAKPANSDPAKCKSAVPEPAKLQPARPSWFRQAVGWLSGLSIPWQGSRRVARA
jgi:predicted DNA binding CopG/RHH family protein